MLYPIELRVRPEGGEVSDVRWGWQVILWWRDESFGEPVVYPLGMRLSGFVPRLSSVLGLLFGRAEESRDHEDGC